MSKYYIWTGRLNLSLSRCTSFFFVAETLGYFCNLFGHSQMFLILCSFTDEKPYILLNHIKAMLFSLALSLPAHSFVYFNLMVSAANQL
jgi:hypothetical protein